MADAIAETSRPSSHRSPSDHPFAIVRATPEERAAGQLAGDRLGAVVESLRVHGAAILSTRSSWLTATGCTTR
jgi:hypothetical protein